MTDKQKQQRKAALDRLMRALSATTSFCDGCASGTAIDVQHAHYHAHNDRASYALLLVEAAAPALEQLIAEHAELKKQLSVPGCSAQCVHVNHERES